METRVLGLALLWVLLMPVNWVIPNGAKGDGIHDDYAALLAANTTAVSLGSAVELGTGTYRIGSDLALDTVIFMPGASLAPDGGVTVTVAEPIAFGVSTPALPAEVGVVNPYYPYGDVRRYGAVGDGTTDNLTAINNASASVAAMLGGIVFFPPGTFGVSNAVVIPNRVAFVGSGRDIGPTATAANGHGTILSALASFPHDTPLVQLADGSAQAFGCRAENLCIHCNAIAGSTGVKSAVAQESSGLRRVTVRGYMAKGVDFTDTDATLFNGNYLLSEVELLCDATATNTTGFYWASKNGAFGMLQRVSINSKNLAADQTAAIDVVNAGVGSGKGNLIVIGANIEGHAIGLHAEANTFVIASGIGGYASQGGGTSLIQLESGACADLSGVYRNSAYTNTITDNVSGRVVTDQFVTHYTQGVATQDVPVVTLADAATITANSATSRAFKVTITAARTIGAPTNARSGHRITYTIVQDGTGGWALSWDTVFKQSWSDTGNTAGKRSTISFLYDGTNWNQDGAQSPYI